MKLVVDGQLFQTGALERGMGTLTMELLRAAQRQDSTLEVVILLNDKLPMTEEHTTRLHTLLEGFTLDHISMETPATGPETRAKTQLEAYIDTIASTNNDVSYIVPALFLFDYFALFPKNCKTILVFHDLIPLVMWQYLKNVFPGHVYFARFPHMFEADIILANSENTKQELVSLLGLDDSNIVVMGGAPETIPLTKSEALKRVRKLGVPQPYMLLPTGGGYMDHKNNMRVAEALYLLSRDTDRKFTVVTTSRYEVHEREAMRRYLGDAIQFTGNISTADMQALYCCAAVVIAPALAEGLGIPLLNAISQGTPIAASRIPVYTELSVGESVFYEFDPYDVWEIRDALLAALARVGFERKRKAYKKLLARYTWDNCARHLLTAMIQEVRPRPQTSRRLDVLMPDPLTDMHEGYLAQSLTAATTKHGYDAHYYIDPSVSPAHYDDRGADYVRYIAPTYDISAYDPLAKDRPATILFLPQDANFARLHLLSRVLEGAIIYVSGDGSDELYNVLVEDGEIDSATAEQERKAQHTLTKAGMFNVPHPFFGVRAVLVEARTAGRLRKLLDALDIHCPVRVVPDNQNQNLNDYVHQAEPVNDMILDFITEVTGND